jgi:hypothetical protein
MRRIAGLPQRDGIDQMDMPLKERCEGGFIALGILF